MSVERRLLSHQDHLHLPDHSGLEFGLDLDRITIPILARANVENGEDRCDRDPQSCVCHETAWTDPSSVTKRRGRRIQNLNVLTSIGIQESLGDEIHRPEIVSRVVQNGPNNC